MDKKVREATENLPVDTGATADFTSVHRLNSMDPDQERFWTGPGKLIAKRDRPETMDVIDRYKRNNDTIRLLIDEIVKWLGEQSVREMNVGALRHALGEVKSLAKSNFEHDLSEIAGRLGVEPDALDDLPSGAPSPAAAANRQYFLLRFVACSFSDQIGHNRISRHILMGLEKYLENLLGPELYEVLNEECRLLLEDLDALPDAEIWEAAFSDGWRRILSLQILFRIVSQFHNFDRAVQTFLAVVENASPKNTRPPNRLTFITIFDRLIRPLEFCLQADADKVLFDFLLGAGGQEVVEEVRSKYAAWKSGRRSLAK